MKVKLVVKNMLFYGFHGSLEVERELGQKFLVDLEVVYDLPDPDKDNEAESINYQHLYSIASEYLRAHKYRLIETLAYKLCKEVLNRFSVVEAVTVKIKRPQLYISGLADSVELELTVTR